MYTIEFVLKEVRIKHGLTQKQLSKLSHLSQTYISLLENKIKIPDLNAIAKISNGLNIHPMELLKVKKI